MNITNEKIRFLDNGDGTVTDNDTGLVWSQKDSWQIHNDWLTFQESLSWIDELNKKDFLGFHDWRIPEKEEIEKLFTPNNIIIGRSKQELKIDSAFEIVNVFLSRPTFKADLNPTASTFSSFNTLGKRLNLPRFTSIAWCSSSENFKSGNALVS